MKNLANYLTLSRIVLSILLLFTKPLSTIFFIIFIICGITDVLDGYIARKYSLSSDFGAKLDSIADIVFFLCYSMVMILVLYYNSPVIYWIMFIIMIKIISLFIGFVKFRKFSMIHTYLNKITGMCLILLPFLLLLTSSNLIISIICLIATLASIEELMIIYFSKKLILNCGSIFKIQ